jgi:predicted transcriptional regulator
VGLQHDTKGSAVVSGVSIQERGERVYSNTLTKFQRKFRNQLIKRHRILGIDFLPLLIETCHTFVCSRQSLPEIFLIFPIFILHLGKSQFQGKSWKQAQVETETSGKSRLLLHQFPPKSSNFSV